MNLKNIQILSPQKGKILKLIVFVPIVAADKVRETMLSAGAGKIGNYDMCSYNMTGYGTFRACQGAEPFCGEIGSVHKEEEVRVEVVLPDYNKNKVLRAMLSAHPYEEPAYDIIQLENANAYAGSGVVGELIEPMDEKDFLNKVKDVFKVGSLKYSSLTGKKIKRVALCGGSGAFLINDAVSASS